jgi:hypothetical protein
MELKAAQRDMTAAYVGGAPGIMVSGLAWLSAGVAWLRSDTATAFAVLFVGGMLIVPLALLICRMLFKAPKVMPGNPLERLGLETTFALFGGLAIAFAALKVAPELSLPAFAIIIGTRYTLFRSLYDQPLYWLLGGLIALAGCLALFGVAAFPGNVALWVGGIELVLAGVVLARR